MRIGIMSMQRVMNHGSFLQAYALKKTTEVCLPGAECVFIDLPNAKASSPQRRRCLDLLRFWYHRIRKHETICNEYTLRWNSYRFTRIYRNCLKKHLGITDRLNYKTDYDAVIIGSDEVFNCTQEDASWGTSMALFGEGVASRKLISYSASFGYTTEARIQQFGLYDRIADNLRRFYAISVRDNNSEQIVKKMLGIEPSKNLDPVFIYDYQKELKRKKKRSKNLVIYQYQNRICEQKAIDVIKTIARKTKCRIVSVFEHCDWADENRVCTPFEAMEYMNNAEYVITDTFHGCVMSIKFNKRFAAFCRESNRNKVLDLLQTFHLEGQLITAADDIWDVLNHEIDWEKVNQTVETQRNCAIQYLSDSLMA